MKEIHIVCLVHKRTLNHIEIIKTFADRGFALLYIEEENIKRPVYSRLILKSYRIEDL